MRWLVVLAVVSGCNYILNLEPLAVTDAALPALDIPPPPCVLEPTDNFDDDSIDLARWTVGDPAGKAVVSEENRQLVITLPTQEQQAPDQFAYNELRSNLRFDFTDVRVVVEIAGVPNLQGYTEMTALVTTQAGEEFRVTAGAVYNIDFGGKVGGKPELSIQDFQLPGDRFWSMRYDAVLDTVVFETSPNMTLWKDRFHMKPTALLTNAQLHLIGGSFQFGRPDPGVARYEQEVIIPNVCP